MNRLNKTNSYRFCLAAACCLVVVAAWTLSATAGSNPGPDVTVHYLPSVANQGGSGGMHGYSVGTTSCNLGDQPLWWCDDDRSYCEDDQHPVIAQNLYRLKNDRFEQIGMSWLKHGFLSLNTPDSSCGSCAGPPHGGDQLGVGCTDAYGSFLNGNRPLGMRSEVNAANGTYPFPYTNVGSSGVDQWIQVLDTDLDPSLNAGALYWVEGHYVAADDALAGNGLNNASYRQVTVSPGSLNLSMTGSTIREKSAIEVWPTLDPDVQLINVDIGDSHVTSRYHVARKVSPISGGNHYEYAIHNMNSDRSAHSFTIQFPVGTTISNAGFHNVPHHSGEPYATTDWVSTIDNGAGTITWATDDFATDNDANALRWGTTFSFWVDANGAAGTHTLGMFKPGTPNELTFNFALMGIFDDGFESGDTTAWTVTVP